MRILFVSFFFPPYDAIGSLRTSKTAKYLTRFGHDVRVVSARDQGGPLATLRLEIPPDRVSYTRWLNPRSPIEMISGRGQMVPWSDNRMVSASSRLHWLRRAAFKLLRSALYFPDPQAGWLPFAWAETSRVVRIWRPDVVFASAGPVTSLIVAHLIARQYSIPWVADLRDLWAGNQYYQYSEWRRQLDLKLERRVLSSALGLVTVSRPLADALQSFGKPIEVIHNGFDPEDYSAFSKTLCQNGDLRIVYTGMIYPGRQTTAPLFEALRLMGAKAEKVRVVFYGSPSALVGESARASGVEHLIEINSTVSHHEAIKAQIDADVLLHLLWNDPTQPGVYNAKVFEYLGARRPILAVGYQGNLTAQLICEREAGVALSDPVAIAAQLSQWIQQKEQAGMIPPLAPDVAAGLSRDEQARRLEAFLQKLLNSAGEHNNDVAKRPLET